MGRKMEPVSLGVSDYGRGEGRGERGLTRTVEDGGLLMFAVLVGGCVCVCL